MAVRPPALRRNVRLTAAGAVVVVAGMAGLTAVSEPLYRLFCEATGYGGTPRVTDIARPGANAAEAMITVRFDANVNRDLAWRFRPAERQMTVRVGEEILAFYEARNTSDRPIVGTATFNVQPDRAAIYFNKLECFCFTEQVLAPGESVRMPVTFFVDPEIAKDPRARDVAAITLSYTFFRSEDQSKARVAQAHTQARTQSPNQPTSN
jgi:cytochrome c oxidase assembly protein subunit 11